MVLRQGRPWMVFGTPGADIQVQAMVQVVSAMVDRGMDPQQAVELPRFGSYSYPGSFWPHRAEPGVVRAEARIAPTVLAEMVRRGHSVQPWPAWAREAGCVCVVAQATEPRTVIAGADPRAESSAAGW